MKTIKAIAGFFLLSMVISTGIKAQAQTSTSTQNQTEQMTVPLSEPGKPYKLNVDLVYGSIKIVGYEGKDIVIDAEAGDKRKTKAKDKDNDDDNDGIKINVN